MTDQDQPPVDAVTEAQPKKKRRPRAELKQLLLDTGVELLKERGMGLGADWLTYKVVFDHLMETQGILVTRGSGHERTWHGQRAYQLDVLAEACRYTPEKGFYDAVAAAQAVVDAADDKTSVAGRAAIAREVSRVGGNVDIAGARGSVDLKIWLAIFSLYTLAGDDPEPGGDAIHTHISAGYQKNQQIYIDAYANIIDQLGGVANPDLFGTGPDAQQQAVELLSIILPSLIDGLVLACGLLDEESGTVQLPTGPDRTPQEWHLASIGLYALFTGMFTLT